MIWKVQVRMATQEKEIEWKTCPVCGRSFATYSGRRVHERKAHPVDFANEELEEMNRKSNKRWTDDEMYLLAQRDAALEQNVKY